MRGHRGRPLEPAGRRGWIAPAKTVAPAATVTLAAAFALRRLDDFDTWWHLAAGRWIVGHTSIPATDTLSHTVRDHPWINLQWGYDVAIYLLYSVGGPVLLPLAAACGFSLAVWLLLRLARAHLGDAGGALLVLLVVLVLQERFAVRPEMVSFPLLMGIVTILDRGRRRAGRGLWLLVPTMIVWVNVHALFVIGAFAIVCALAGSLAGIREGSSWDSAPSRKLALWGPISLAATILNPFGLEGVLFPAKLLSRINGSNPAFQSIAEFRSPFAADLHGVSIAAYRVLLVGGVAAVLAGLIVSLRRVAGSAAGRSALDLGGLAFLAGLAALSLLARRNAALFALGGAPVIARALATIVPALPVGARGRPREALGAALLAAGSLALAGAVVTGAFYRWDDETHEFGWGVLEGTFPVRAAAFVREARLPPELYNDVAAGGYLAWDDPIGNGVFIDGRLEVYEAPFFSAYVSAMYDPALWEAEADRFGVQTVVLFHHWENRRRLVEHLASAPAWSLVYADEVAAVFVRARGNERAIARAGSLAEKWNRATREWLERPVPRWRYPAGRIEGTRAFALLLATIGDAEGSAEQFTRLLELGVSRREEFDIRLRLARLFLATGRGERAQEQVRRILELDPGNREAQGLLRGD